MFFLDYIQNLPLLQRQIQFSELTEVVPIAEGGFGVIHRAKHHEWGTVIIIIIMEKTEAGLRGLCILDIDVKSQILVT